MESKLPEEQNQAERLMAMGQMAASMAHEIRNPLCSMELFCSLLMKDLTSQPELLNLAEQMKDGIETLDRIISNCLQFTRESKPKLSVVSDVASLINSIISEASGRAIQKNVTIDLSLSGSGNVCIDSYLFKQAILNLVLNAIDASAQKRDSIKNATEFKPEVNVISDLTHELIWRVDVVDNGVGIPEEHLKNIFDPFFTTKSDGTGLGLAIVHSLVTAHDGKISIDSKVNDGTRVSVFIPRFSANKESE